MLIPGEWFLADDGIERPIIRGEVLAGDRSWVATPFLLDTGADRTVLSSAILASLRLPPVITGERLGGLGGSVPSVIVETQIRLTRKGEGKVIFRGRYAALTEPEALDIILPGRDITGLFAVIMDKPRNVVCLPGQRHHYRIEED